MFLSIIIPIFVSGTLQHRKEDRIIKRIGIFLYDLLTAIIIPIKFHYRLIVAKSVRKSILERCDVSFASAYMKITKRIQQIEKEITTHKRLQQGLETIYQLAGNVLLIFYANSYTRTSQGLSALFESDGIDLFGISISPNFVVMLNIILNFLSFTSANVNGTRVNSYHYPIMSKIMLAISIFCSCATRIMAMNLFFAPVLGLFDLLMHYKGKSFNCSGFLLASDIFFSF